MTASRRGFITGLVSLVAAPAIVRAGSLMPVRVMIEPYGRGPMMNALLHQAHRMVDPPLLLEGDLLYPIPVHPLIWQALVDLR